MSDVGYLDCSATDDRSYFGLLSDNAKAFDWDIIFVAGSLVGHSLVKLYAEMARRKGCIVVGFAHCAEDRRDRGGIVENLRQMLRISDTVILIDPIANWKQASLASEFSCPACCDTASAICDGLSSAANSRLLRSIIRRGHLARVSSGVSCASNVEEAVLNALTRLLPIADFAEAPAAFVTITSPQDVDKKVIANALGWFSKLLSPDIEIVCSTRRRRNITAATVTLLVTGVAFPYASPSYRKLPIELHDLEPESSVDGIVRIALPLDQLEQLETC